MNEPDLYIDSELARDLEIEEICERYEEAWREGRFPEIAACFGEIDPAGVTTLKSELETREHEWRRRWGQVNSYQSRFKILISNSYQLSVLISQPWWNNHGNWWVEREQCIEDNCSNDQWEDLLFESEEECIGILCPEDPERDRWVVLWDCPGQCEGEKIICGGMCCPEDYCHNPGEPEEWCDYMP